MIPSSLTQMRGPGHIKRNQNGGNARLQHQPGCHWVDDKVGIRLIAETDSATYDADFLDMANNLRLLSDQPGYW